VIRMNRADGTRRRRASSLSRAEESEIVQYCKAGVSQELCASMFNVSVLTVRRIQVKFQAEVRAVRIQRRREYRMDPARVLARWLRAPRLF
jgi:hypothetical protein